MNFQIRWTNYKFLFHGLRYVSAKHKLTQTLRSKRPGRRSAGSNKSLLFVAAKNMTPLPVSNPSSSIKSWFNVVSLSWVAALYRWSVVSLNIPWRLTIHKHFMSTHFSTWCEMCQLHHYIIYRKSQWPNDAIQTIGYFLNCNVYKYNRNTGKEKGTSSIFLNP